MECFGSVTYFQRFWTSDSKLYRWSVIVAIIVDLGESIRLPRS